MLATKSLAASSWLAWAHLQNSGRRQPSFCPCAAAIRRPAQPQSDGEIHAILGMRSWTPCPRDWLWRPSVRAKHHAHARNGRTKIGTCTLLAFREQSAFSVALRPSGSSSSKQCTPAGRLLPPATPISAMALATGTFKVRLVSLARACRVCARLRVACKPRDGPQNVRPQRPSRVAACAHERHAPARIFTRIRCLAHGRA